MTFKFLRILLASSLIVNGILLFRNYDRMRVVEVLDGDTFRVKSGERIRIDKFDAPEEGECGYEAAKRNLEELVLGEVVTIKNARKDYWGRTIGLVYVRDVLINEELVETCSKIGA